MSVLPAGNINRVQAGQKGVLDPLKLELLIVESPCGCWELKPGPLRERATSVFNCQAISPHPCTFNVRLLYSFMFLFAKLSPVVIFCLYFGK